jgi:quinol monooxygenase YgiN
MIFIVVKFTVRPEYSDDWPERVSAFTQATRSEEGNLWFEWARSVERPHEYVLLEAFTDAEAGARHVGSQHFSTAMAQLASMVARVPDIVNVEVPGTGWSKLSELAPLAQDEAGG